LQCCRVLQCVAVCCSVLQCCNAQLTCKTHRCAHSTSLHLSLVCCSVLQYVAVCCSVLQCVAVCCSVAMRNWHLKPTGMLTLHRRTQASSLISRAIDTYTYIRIHIIRIYTCEYVYTHTYIRIHTPVVFRCSLHTATHCNALQHTATHYNTLKQAFSLISRVLMRGKNCFPGLVRDF